MAPKPNFALDDQSAITAELAEKALYEDNLETNAAQLTLYRGQLAIILEVADGEFKRKVEAAQVVGRLAQNLHQLRSQAGLAIWKELIPIAQGHGIQEFLQQDPFTKWSFEKPRGYSGDATLLDIYYQHQSAREIVEKATPLGREIYEYTSNAASSVAGRERRDILAQYVDNAAQNFSDAEVLSVACAHLRESEKVEALKNGGLERCWEMVKPGGTFLFANFSDEIQTDGYMETFMDWPLILRNADDMLDIANSAIDASEADIRAFYGSNRNIVYAEMKKRG